MKNLRKLAAAVVLTFALALSAFAGEVLTPPCAAPGQVDTPPCSSAPGDMNTPRETPTPPGDMGNGGTLFAEIATDVMLNILSLY